MPMSSKVPSINYTGLIPYMLKVIQDQQNEINNLKNEINNINDKLNDLISNK